MSAALALALVTGAPGWLGTRLVEALVRGLADVPALREPPARAVRVLVHSGGDARALRALSPRIEVVEGDLTEPASLVPFVAGAAGATLFHAAGLVHPRRRVRELYAVNAAGTASLVAAAREARVRRFVHVSSDSPVGLNPTRDRLLDEDSPLRPYRNYGRSKLLAEQAVEAADRRGDIETVIVRPPWFYGPGQPARQTRFYSMIRAGRAPIVGSGQNLRSMAYVDNICQGLLLCERVEAARGRVYWIADRRPYATNEIVDTVERVMERDFGIACAHRRLRLPGIASDVASAADAFLQAVDLYSTEVHVLSEMNKDIACSIARAERELGYAPAVALEEGMRRSLAWMRAQGIEP